MLALFFEVSRFLAAFCASCSVCDCSCSVCCRSRRFFPRWGALRLRFSRSPDAFSSLRTLIFHRFFAVALPHSQKPATVIKPQFLLCLPPRSVILLGLGLTAKNVAELCRGRPERTFPHRSSLKLTLNLASLHFGGVAASLGWLLGVTWPACMLALAALGRSLASLGRFWGSRGRVLNPLGRLWGASWVHFGVQGRSER